MKAISAMFESISCDWPIPIGWPIAFSFGAAALTWSHVAGDSPIAVPEVVPPDDRVGHVAVRDGEVLLRLRVVRRRLGDRHVLADLPLDLVDDRRVVDHLVLVRGHRVEVEEQVVPLLRRHLRGRARVEEAVVDVLDRDLDVVLLAPRLRPGIEPLVVRGHEVHPRERRQVPGQPAPLVPQRPCERERRGRAGDPDRRGARARLLQELAPAESARARPCSRSSSSFRFGSAIGMPRR